MALTVNTKIINDVDNYSLDAKQVKGGYGVVNTVSDLSSLPPATIVKGSLYYVQAVDKFYKYNGSAWEEAQFGGGTWGSITGTLSDQTDLQNALNLKEAVANKTTTITSSSTDTQYPSAKVVYDTTEDIREIAAGKNANYVVSTASNPSLNTQASTVDVTSIVNLSGQTITADKFKRGDNVYITETDVPDRWVGNLVTEGSTTTATLYKLETAKVPVTDVQVNGTTVITSGTTVANIPTGTSSLFGVYKVQPNFGTNQGGGVLYIEKANEQDLINKTSLYKPVVANTLNIAIREGLGNNSLTWTDQYKSSARTTIGAASSDDIPNVVRL